MNSDEIYELFEKHNDDYLRFEKVTNKLSNSPDLHAFLLIAKHFLKEKGNIIHRAEHKMIYMNTDLDLLRKNINEDIIRELVYCGVSYCQNYETFYKFT